MRPAAGTTLRQRMEGGVQKNFGMTEQREVGVDGEQQPLLWDAVVAAQLLQLYRCYIGATSLAS